MVKVHGLDDPQVQQEMVKVNRDRWDPHVDRNLLRTPDRMIHVFSISAREFVIDRPPLWLKLHLRACPKGQRYVAVAHIPDPLMQAVHDTEKARKRGEANDGMLCAIELLNPNNPTYDPDWEAPPEIAAKFSSSKGCNLFAQGLFLSLNEVPTEDEIRRAEKRREKMYSNLIAHADSLEETNRKDLEEFLKTEEGADLRLALDYFGEKRSYHKPRTATRSCPNCFEDIKVGAAFHVLPGGVYCVNDWQKAVDAGVKTKFDVPPQLRWWSEDDDEEEAEPETAEAAPRTSASRTRSRSSKGKAAGKSRAMSPRGSQTPAPSE